MDLSLSALGGRTTSLLVTVLVLLTVSSTALTASGQAAVDGTPSSAAGESGSVSALDNVVGYGYIEGGIDIIRVYGDAADSKTMAAVGENFEGVVLPSRFTTEEMANLRARVIASAEQNPEASFGTHYDAEKDVLRILGNEHSKNLAYVSSGEVEYVYSGDGRESRSVDSTPYSGGAYIRGGGQNCTSGFTVLINGTRRMLTAGHCGTPGTSFYNSTTGVRLVGTMVRSNMYPTHDIGYLTGGSYGPNIYVTNTFRRAVVHAGDPGLGGGYCVSGNSTGEICGLSIQSKTDALCDDGICSEAMSYKFTTTARTAGGDSGAAIYAYYGTTGAGVRGIHIGRKNEIGYATRWAVIQALFGASVVTP